MNQAIKTKKFPNISYRAFAHPADLAAIATLKKLRGFDTLVKKVLSFISDRRLRLLFLANTVRVNKEQLPRLHQGLIDVCEFFDLQELPELYVAQNHSVNAMAVGFDKPFIVLNSGLIHGLDEEEVRFVLAHEVAHILSGHTTYRTITFVLLSIMNRFVFRALALPTFPFIIALLEWQRKSELSSDRGALLYCQDLSMAQKIVLKLTGGSGSENYNIDEFENQAKEYEETNTVVDSLFKFLNLVWSTHPFPIERLVELRRWALSADYERVLSGDYPRRSEDGDQPIQEAVKKASTAYGEKLKDSRDPFLSLFREVFQAGEEVVSDVFGRKR